MCKSASFCRRQCACCVYWRLYANSLLVSVWRHYDTYEIMCLGSLYVIRNPIVEIWRSQYRLISTMGFLYWYDGIFILNHGPGINKFHLRVLDLQMSCRDLTTWRGTTMIASQMAARYIAMPSERKHGISSHRAQKPGMWRINLLHLWSGWLQVLGTQPNGNPIIDTSVYLSNTHHLVVSTTVVVLL